MSQTGGGGCTLGISGWGCAAVTLEPLTYTRATILDKINGKPRPRSSPNQEWGKLGVFAFRAPLSLIRGGWGFAVPFYFVQDCSSAEFCYPIPQVAQTHYESPEQHYPT